MTPSSWIWLVVLWASTFGAVAGAVVVWWAAGQLRAYRDERLSNVICLPPRADRGGPTHVVRVARPFDFEQERA